MGTIYPVWETTVSQFPPRSRLNNLEPIGIGTADVESLTSYIARLAEAHCVNTRHLVEGQIWPLLKDVNQNRSPRNRFGGFENAEKAINGRKGIARNWVRVLEILTLRNDLRFLTMTTWGSVVSGSSLTRPKRAWCPICLEEWRMSGLVIYEPLIWVFEAVVICPHHQRFLQSTCPHCNRELKHLSSRSRPGYCSLCQEWLGFGGEAGFVDRNTLGTEQWDYQIWTVYAIGELLASAPYLLLPPKREKVVESLSACIHRFADGNLSRFSRLVDVLSDTLSRWQAGKGLPRFDLQLNMCYRVGISLRSFLTETLSDNPDWDDAVFFRPAELTPSRIRPSEENVRQVLTSAFNEYPPPSLAQLAGRIGYKSENSIRFRFPDLARDITLRHRSQCQRTFTHRTHRAVKAALQTVLESEEVKSLEQIAISLGYSGTATLSKRFPVLWAAVVIKRRQLKKARDEKERETIHLELLSALKEHPPPAMNQIARRLGNKRSSDLRKWFPSLCKTISARYRESNRRLKLTRQRILEAALREDPPPSAREVAENLGVRSPILFLQFPDLARQVSKRYKEYQRACVLIREKELEGRIRAITSELMRNGVYPSRSQISARVCIGASLLTRLLKEIRLESV